MWYLIDTKLFILAGTNPLRTSFKGNISPTAEKVALEGMPCLGDVCVLTINIRESLEFKVFTYICLFIILK